MWPSVQAAIGPFLAKYEGSRRNMYLDKSGRVATGIGTDINSPAAANLLVWQRRDGSTATASEVAAEWARVNALQAYKGVGGGNPPFSTSAVLFVEPASLAAYTARLFANDEAVLRSSARIGPAWDVSTPADGQMGRLRTAYADGEGSTATKDEWPKLDAAIARGDFVTAEAESQPKDLEKQPKAYRDSYAAVKVLYSNAAEVVKRGLDPSVLYYPRNLATGGGGGGGGGALAISSAFVVLAGLGYWAYVQERKPAWLSRLLRPPSRVAARLA